VTRPGSIRPLEFLDPGRGGGNRVAHDRMARPTCGITEPGARDLRRRDTPGRAVLKGRIRFASPAAVTPCVTDELEPRREPTP
jgi:hypothetical protein